MKTFPLLTTMAILPGAAFAHEAGGIAHLHPHGGEALLALIALVAVIGIWRVWRS